VTFLVSRLFWWIRLPSSSHDLDFPSSSEIIKVYSYSSLYFGLHHAMHGYGLSWLELFKQNMLKELVVGSPKYILLEEFLHLKEILPREQSELKDLVSFLRLCTWREPLLEEQIDNFLPGVN
ncbi:hypothetical protein HAX54_013869, partial [Datura stramonium]|nr:hypothetical protein [Datura stramonium]